MAQKKKKWVAFRTNTTVPAEVIGKTSNEKMQAGQPVLLPETYADHVIHEGFAVACDAPKKAEVADKVVEPQITPPAQEEPSGQTTTPGTDAADKEPTAALDLAPPAASAT
ncbi:hypothetical protein FHS89_001792 [Rubricella aquisinus]|uniref:Uncharacterized protein n=1 Tax=Rubricella aquisinus TaxID=2028108 RepID=A0A840WQ31_9RHOB|nr:hypothetical protein [Rubricella aquisinus]MBB5515772.1 hypothetical protein [Rubricella aquisinus]